MNFLIKADRTKLNNTSWDGYDSSGVVDHLFINIPTSPPDIMICIIDLQGNSKCYYKKNDNNKVISQCPNSFDCDFYDIPVPKEIFGLLIADLDEAMHDLIDCVVITEKQKSRDAPEVLKINQNLLKLAKKVAPPLTQGENDRRTRPFQIYKISKCLNDLPCELRQSRFEIFTGER